jgi:large subunit ribosomal protein L15
MKLHDLRPADGSRKARTRVGRGIAAGKGKTAGRGTKGQKARAGGSIPPWFEGGQTPLHMRIPKLRGFTNRFKVDYEVVNVGAIEAVAQRGAFALAVAAGDGPTAGPMTVNQDILRAVGLVRTLRKPLKILGNGDLATSLFVVADAFTASARRKIEAAGGSVNVLEVPATPMAALGLTGDTDGGAVPKNATPRIGKHALARTAAIARTAALAAATATAREERAAAAAAKPVRSTAAARAEKAAALAAAKPAKGGGGAKGGGTAKGVVPDKANRPAAGAKPGAADSTAGA